MTMHALEREMEVSKCMRVRVETTYSQRGVT